MAEPIRLRDGAAWLVRVGAVASAGVYLACHPWRLTGDFFAGAPLGRDFVNFWLGPRLALEGRASVLFDWVAYNDLVGRIAERGDDVLVFSYPPPTLLPLAPLALLPFLPALAVFSLAGVAALVAAARSLGASRGLALVAALSPAGAMGAIWGHFGGVLALAATLALGLAGRRPAAAGALLAIVAVKPQLALALGGILLAAGFWRCVIWSALFAALLVAASVAAFGVEPWQGFVAWTMPLHTRLLLEFHFSHLRTTIGLYTSARLLGLAAGPALAIQAVFGTALLAGAVLVLRRHGPTPAAVGAVLLAALLALPYANSYDLAVAAPALTVALLGREHLPGIRAADAPGPVPAILWLAPALTPLLAAFESPVIGVALALASGGFVWTLLAHPRPSPGVVAAAA